MIFLNSIGGISGVDLPTWNEKYGSNVYVKSTAIVIVWIFWFINVFTMTIVFLNFVIAVVGNTYNEVKTTGTVFIYSTKAEMNFLVQLILNFLGKQTNFVALVFIAPKSMARDSKNELSNYSAGVKSEVQGLLRMYQDDIDKGHLKYDRHI